MYQARLPLGDLPAQVREPVTRSVGAALEVTGRIEDPELGRRLADLARAAFVSRFRTAFVVATVVALVAAAMVARFGSRYVTDGDDEI